MGNGESIEGAEDFPPKVPLFQNNPFHGVPDNSGIVTKPMSMGFYKDLPSIIEDKICSLTGVQFVKHKIGFHEQIQIPPDSTLFQLGNGKLVVLKKEEVAMVDQKPDKAPDVSKELEKAAVGMLEELGYTVTKNQNETEAPTLTEEQKENARNETQKLVEEMKTEFERGKEIRANYQKTVKSLFKISGWGKPKF